MGVKGKDAWVSWEMGGIGLWCVVQMSIWVGLSGFGALVRGGG